MTDTQQISLEAVSKDRNNNLNIMRFIAALMVIFSHAVPLTLNHSDILNQWTDGNLNFGGIAVGVFFVTGGYLIAKSAEGKKTAKKYFTARCLRILPQLIFVTVITVFVLGPIVSTDSVNEYFTNSQTWRYLLNCIFVLQHHLPGVFEQNVYASVVNGALWTLPVEFLCYILCFIAYKLGFFSAKRFRYTIPLVFLVAAGSVLTGSSYLISVFRPVVLFYIGIGMYVYRKKIVMCQAYGILSVALYVLLLVLKLEILAMYLIFPYMIFYLAFGVKHKFSRFGQKGEYSYGMYLWGFPVGQTLCMIAGNHMHWFVNAVLTSVIAVLLGILNCYVVDCTVNKFQK